MQTVIMQIMMNSEKFELLFSYFTLFYVPIIFSLRKGSSSTKISGEATAPTLDNCQNSERPSP